MNATKSLFLGLLIIIGPLALAADWPQYRGINRDGISRETGLLKTWPEAGPKLLGTYANAGVGYSSPSIVGDNLYMTGGRGADDVLFCIPLTAATGGEATERWAVKIGPVFKWEGNTWNAGPSVAPTVADGLVFALGGFGDLVCVEAATGKEKWRTNLPRDLGGEVNPIGGGLEKPTPLGWGYASAPLVDGDQLICMPGGKDGLFAALDKNTGKVLWRSKDVTDQASYASPLVAEPIAGVRQYIAVTNKGIVGVFAKDGKSMWRYTRERAFEDVVIATPLFHDDRVYATVGFGEGCELIKVSLLQGGWAAWKEYSNREVQNRNGGVVLIGDHIYGHSEKGGWVCQEFKSGKVKWAENDALARGSIAAADGMLYCCAEKGGVVALVEPNPSAWNEKGRLRLPKESKRRLPSGGLWTPPVIAGGKLFIRDQELLFCYDVKK